MPCQKWFNTVWARTLSKTHSSDEVEPCAKPRLIPRFIRIGKTDSYGESAVCVDGWTAAFPRFFRENWVSDGLRPVPDSFRRERSPSRDGATGASRQHASKNDRSGPVSRVLSRATISLGRRLPAASSNLPGSRLRTGPARGGKIRTPSCLVLLPVGFAEPSRSPGLLVRSYRTVSPLPRDNRSTSEQIAARRSTFCCTFPILTDGGRYPPPRPMEPGLSSARTGRAAAAWPTSICMR